MGALSTNEDLLRRPALLIIILSAVALVLTWLTALVPQTVPRHHLDPNAVRVDSDYVVIRGIPRPLIVNDPRGQQPPLLSRNELAVNFLVDFACATAVVVVFVVVTEAIPYLMRRSSQRNRASTQ